jgi:thiamine-phosphate pyrophosphorylase
LRAGICAILDLGACAGANIDPLGAARAFCAAPIAALQLRAKDVPDRDLLRLAREVGAVCRARGVPFLVDDRPDIALLSGADGVHVGQDDLPPDRVRALLGPERLVGFSTHSIAQVEAAARLPVDYLGFGPVFPTATKKRADPVVGVDGLRAAAARSPVPIVAIGGIRIADIPAVREAGARAVALVSALLEGGDPAARVAEACAAFPRA